jgi:CpeT protein
MNFIFSCRWVLGAYIFFMSLGACQVMPKLENADLQRLQTYLTGSFDSKEQAKADPKNYSEVILQMKPIWPKRGEGYWLYAEQSLAASPNKPFRQRVYLLTIKEEQLVLEVYILKNPKRFVEAYKNPAVFDAYNLEALEWKQACQIVLEKDDVNFTGKTKDKACPDEQKGAAYATSEWSISSNVLINWERSFDTADKQISGATQGGYIFKKIEK